MFRRIRVPAQLRSGPFTLDHALEAGLSSWHLESRSWRRLGPRIYVWAGLPDTPLLHLKALLLRCPPGAAFSGLTAAWLHHLDVEPCKPIEITIPKGIGVSGRAGAVVRRDRLAPGEITTRQGVPVTTLPRTLSDIARRRPLVEATVIADMALHAGLAALADLQPAATPRLRRVLELAEPRTESPMETRLRLLLVLAGLPRPEAQVSIRDEGGRFLGRPDLLYPAQQLALEYDGGVHRDQLVADNRRQNLLINAGYRLLRFTGADVFNHPDAVVAQVRGALGARRAA